MPTDRRRGRVKVYSEQVSSVAQRAQLAAALDFVREGDVLMATKPDRLARNAAELLKIEADLSANGGFLRPPFRRRTYTAPAYQGFCPGYTSPAKD